MKKVFALAMVLGFLLMGSLSFAWEDPCSATEHIYTYSGGYMLAHWTETPQFSPAPKCGGVVTLFCPDGSDVELEYMGLSNGIMWIDGVLCHVDG
ncbi:MAG: hypothetical protein KAV87_30630, partial [Desulfobacteraceae bacterium]|nr:hypothetical protein [Desulfobacteraceae bacterium]